jgi:hypothetical protein
MLSLAIGQKGRAILKSHSRKGRTPYPLYIGTSLIVLALLFFVGIPIINGTARVVAKWSVPKKDGQLVESPPTTEAVYPTAQTWKPTIESTRAPDIFRSAMNYLEHPNASDPGTYTMGNKAFAAAVRAAGQIGDGYKKHPGWNLPGVITRLLRVCQDAPMDKPATMAYNEAIRKLKATGCKPSVNDFQGVPVRFEERR